MSLDENMLKEDIRYFQTVHMTHPFFDILLTNISNPKVTKVTRTGSLVASCPALLAVARHFILGTTNFNNVRNNINFMLTQMYRFSEKKIKKLLYTILLYNCTVRIYF